MASAPDFQKLISDARERKKNSALADRIFSRDRRQSAPSKFKPTPGGSLASRVGVKKQRAIAAAPAASSTRRASLPAGNVNGEWTHDLHDSVNGAQAKGGSLGSLGSRITVPGTKNSSTIAKRAANRKAKLAAAVDKMDTDQVNVIPSTRATNGMGLTIRGLAGPYALLGQNFAPGTTAADIESAMTPVGGEMASCKIVKTKPFLIAEMVFVSREGGERVIETFNNKTADGKVIKIYPKVGGHQASAADRTNEPPANAPSGPKSSKGSTRDQVVDGSLGFPDLMDTNGSHNSAAGNNRLYSDRLVGGNKRGRGFQRGRGQ